jgi:hypothetical protein
MSKRMKTEEAILLIASMITAAIFPIAIFLITLGIL